MTAENRNSGWGGLRLALLALPALLFVLSAFVYPVSRFLTLASDNADLSDGLAQTTMALKAAGGIPDEATFAALVSDLARARDRRKDALIAQSLNQRLVGTRFTVLKTARAAAAGAFTPPYATSVVAAFPQWSDPALWQVIAANNTRLTDYHLLASVDLRRDNSGAIVSVAADQAMFRPLLARTIWISASVTLICALLALPLAQAIVSAPPVAGRILFALVLFPLWSSLLVRTVIWIIVLQRNGPVNAALSFLHLTDQPLSLIYTRFSLYAAMIQVLLPLMVLSVVTVLRRTPKTYMKAALSLGAPWFTAWRTVHLPMIMPGLLSGGAIVFVFALGYYITPLLVGGPKDQMVSSLIAFFTNKTLNWGMAAALSIQLLVVLLMVAALTLTLRAIRRRPT